MPLDTLIGEKPNYALTPFACTVGVRFEGPVGFEHWYATCER